MANVDGQIKASSTADQIQIQSYTSTGKTWRIGTDIGSSGANRNLTIWESDAGNVLYINQATGDVTVPASLTVDKTVTIKTPGGDGIVITGDNIAINRIQAIAHSYSMLSLEGGDASITIGGSADYTIVLNAPSVQVPGNLSVDGTLSVTTATGLVTNPVAVVDGYDVKKCQMVTDGNFTATLHGVSQTVTGTAYYRIVAGIVYLELPSLLGTSNSSSLYISGLPAAIRPSTYSRYVPCAGGDVFVDASLQAGMVYAEIDGGGNGYLHFYKADGTVWTTSGTKGINRLFAQVQYWIGH
jgi:hypothetical protein